MKKELFAFLLASLSFAFEARSQNVGINNDGSTPDVSAMLDVKNPTKGMLIPRVALTGTSDITTINSPATSLLIYNTATAGTGSTAVLPGYYYWSGTAWTRILSGATSWTTTGNAGTTPGTHFIGTTDNQPLQFKVNNRLSGHIDIAQINTFFGYQAGMSITTGYGNIGIGQNALVNTTTGFDNIAIGEGTLQNNILGIENLAIGKFALSNNTTGNHNIGLGNLALNANTDGIGNTGIGYYSLRWNTGSSNTGVGRTALGNNTAGYDNTGLGRSALFNNSTGFQNTAVGRNALNANTTGSLNSAIGFESNVAQNNLTNATSVGAYSYANCNNCVILGSVAGQNSATNNVSVGIGTINPSATLDVRRTATTTANFFGTANISHFNHGDEEHTYIRGGKAGAHVLLNDLAGTGNIGVGTASPLFKMDVNGDIGCSVLNHRNTTGQKIILFPTTITENYGIGIQSHLLQIHADLESSDIAFGFGSSTQFTERMRVKGNGNVGIGTNSPTAALDVFRTTNATANFRGSNNVSHFNFGDAEHTYIRGGKAGSYVIINDYPGAGFVGIATGTPGYALDVNGFIRCVTLIEMSDARLKTNIRPVSAALESLMKLNGYHYQWKDPLADQSARLGLLAQEVQAVYPQLVHEDQSGTLAVNYQGLIPVLLEAIKELKKENEELKKMKDEIMELKQLMQSKTR